MHTPNHATKLSMRFWDVYCHCA